MESSTQQSKWYDKTWLVIVLCIFFFPVGLYALWMNASISKGWKIGVTIVIGLFVIAAVNEDPKKQAEREKAISDATQVNTLKDSLAKIEEEKQLALNEQSAKAEQQKEVEQNNYSAYDIDKAYEDNEIAADEQYKSKVFYITGSIDDFDKGPFGGIYVNITGKGFLPIRCEFDLKDKGALAKLAKGTSITVKGKCQGKTVGMISFTDCSLYQQ